MTVIAYAMGSVLGGLLLHGAARWVRGALSGRPVPVPSVSGQAILAGIVALVALGFSVLGWSFFATNSIDVADWEQTDGTITLLEVATEAADRGFSFSGNVNEDLYYVRLEYAYQVAGQDQLGFQRVPNERLFEGRFLQLEPDQLESVQAQYGVGQAVTVYYNPANPAEAALQNDNRTPYLALGGAVGGAAGVLAGVFALSVALFMLRGPAQSEV